MRNTRDMLEIAVELLVDMEQGLFGGSCKEDIADRFDAFMEEYDAN